jgi:hypothetical protein
MNDKVTTAAVGAGGVAIGSIFPLFLFDKFGVADLIQKASQSAESATIFALTIFAMVAMLVVGIGAVMGKIDVATNRSATILLSVFPGVFIIGFVFFIGLAIFNPQVDVAVEVPATSTTGAFLKSLNMQAYVNDHVARSQSPGATAFTVISPNTSAVCRGGSAANSLEFGLVGFERVEKDYGTLHDLRDLAASQCFTKSAMDLICANPQLSGGAVCGAYFKKQNAPLTTLNGG